MESLIPDAFLFRLTLPCRYQADMPRKTSDRILDLSEAFRVSGRVPTQTEQEFAEVRLAWNETGIGIQAEVRGKEEPPRGDEAFLRGSDGLTVWLDTRDSRTSHRASRYCHQFHFLPVGGGADKGEPVFAQAKIHRALQDAPLCRPGDVAFAAQVTGSGYRLEAFLPAAVLHGFDPEQNRRLGFYYAVRDAELGEQTLYLGPDFPYWEDPSLWCVLECVDAV